MLILNGKIGGHGCFLEWQVNDTDGNPVSFDYRGQAWVEGSYLGIERGNAVFEYKVSQTATQESHDRQSGWDYARKQKKQFWPKDKSSEFISGYAECWRHRKGTEKYYTAIQEFNYKGE